MYYQSIQFWSAILGIVFGIGVSVFLVYVFLLTIVVGGELMWCAATGQKPLLVKVENNGPLDRIINGSFGLFFWAGFVFCCVPQHLQSMKLALVLTVCVALVPLSLFLFQYKHKQH